MHASRAASMRMHGLAVYAIHNSPPREALPCHGLLPRTIRRSLLWLVHDHARRHASPSQAHLCSVPDRCTPNEGYIAHSRRLARRLRRTGTVASRRVSCSCRSAVVVSTCTRRRHGLVSGMHTATQSHTLIHAHSRQFDVHSCRILCVLQWRCEAKASHITCAHTSRCLGTWYRTPGGVDDVHAANERSSTQQGLSRHYV